MHSIKGVGKWTVREADWGIVKVRFVGYCQFKHALATKTKEWALLSSLSLLGLLGLLLLRLGGSKELLVLLLRLDECVLEEVGVYDLVSIRYKTLVFFFVIRSTHSQSWRNG